MIPSTKVEAFRKGRAESKIRDWISVKKTELGLGLIAAKSIPTWTVLGSIEGFLAPFSAVVSMGDRECYPVQVAPNVYLCPTPETVWQWINHSCEPTCGISEKLDLVALRNISAGEEITDDYSTTMLERHWTMHCHCGSRKCRKSIGDFDLLPISQQAYYIDLAIVQPFILTSMPELRSNDVTTTR